MKHTTKRTCIGCRAVFPKSDVVRIVAVSGSVVLDYRQKLPGRAAYLCPRRSCIEKALSQDVLSRAFKIRIQAPDREQFANQFAESIIGKIRSLISMSAKSGSLAAGFSAVHDAIQKGRVHALVYASDTAENTKEKLGAPEQHLPSLVVLTRDEMGKILNRELVGVVGFEDRGLAAAVLKEAERLKSLININE